MQLTNYISLILLILFLVSYFLKLAMLYKNYKIKANVLGRREKIPRYSGRNILNISRECKEFIALLSEDRQKK
ncbi:hypothetical protein RDV78_08435 [Bacillota bacterium LX-D]|nr:hypothetical protein [Bacillota bacterium LX-D]